MSLAEWLVLFSVNIQNLQDGEVLEDDDGNYKWSLGTRFGRGTTAAEEDAFPVREDANVAYDAPDEEPEATEYASYARRAVGAAPPDPSAAPWSLIKFCSKSRF